MGDVKLIDLDLKPLGKFRDWVDLDERIWRNWLAVKGPTENIDQAASANEGFAPILGAPIVNEEAKKPEPELDPSTRITEPAPSMNIFDALEEVPQASETPANGDWDLAEDTPDPLRDNSSLQASSAALEPTDISKLVDSAKKPADDLAVDANVRDERSLAPSPELEAARASTIPAPAFLSREVPSIDPPVGGHVPINTTTAEEEAPINHTPEASSLLDIDDTGSPNHESELEPIGAPTHILSLP